MQNVLSIPCGDSKGVLNYIYRGPGQARPQCLKVRRGPRTNFMKENAASTSQTVVQDWLHRCLIDMTTVVISIDVKTALCIWVFRVGKLGGPGTKIQLMIQGTRIPIYVRSEYDIG